MSKVRNKLTDFQKLVLEKIKDIPKGRVAAYVGIARSLGSPGCPGRG